MRDDIKDIRLRMEAAAAALNFEEARRLRNMLSLIRSGATPAAAAKSQLRRYPFSAAEIAADAIGKPLVVSE